MQAKAKEPPTDALPRFLQAYTAHDRVATLTKEQHLGKVVDEWNKSVAESKTKPTVSDMSAAVASFLAVKDAEEMVRYCRGLWSLSHVPMLVTELHPNRLQHHVHLASPVRYTQT